MNLSREVVIAAFLAIMLGIGLGFASYSFIAEIPQRSAVRTLDLHTQRGGLGAGGFGGIFEQNETVQLSAYLTADSLPINQTEVTFTIRNPHEVETVDTSITDSLGNARLGFKLPTDESAIGNWNVTAVAEVENETLSDSITLECQAKEVILPIQRAIDLYTQDGGLGANQSGGFFGPGGLVQLFVYLTANGFPINQTEAVFTVSDPAGNKSVQSALTDGSGIASINVTLPADESAVGNWSVSAVAQVEDEILSDSLVFVCRIASLPIVTVRTLDVYTQRGGLGINESGGIFEQEEVVQLFAYLTANGSPINTTEVAFNLRNPSGNETVESALTDVSGKAKINLTLPSDVSALGIWSILAVANFGNETVSDFMVFDCQVKGVTPPVRTTLDLCTQRGGMGFDEFGGIFGPGEVVQLSACLFGDGFPINQTEVVFTICQYGGNPVADSALTDNRGIAKVNYTIPPGRASEGNWSISAVAQVGNETVSDSLFIGCRTVTASMLVTTKRYGVLDVSFSPLDSVTVDMHVYCEYELLPLELEVGVLRADGSYFLQQSVTTDMWADASIEFRIPWPENGVIGYWHVYVSFEAYGRLIEGSARFEVQLSPGLIDVHTQKGGYGQNVYGGSFLLGENVSLSAMILGALNESLIADKLVSFEVRFNGTTVLVLTAQTDSTGVASVLFSVPQDPSFAGQWEVYARTQFYGQVLLDTLVFAAEQTQG
jgi:hypothetical protein